MKVMLADNVGVGIQVAVALLNCVSGRAGIIEPDGRKFYINLDDELPAPKDATGLHWGMFFPDRSICIERKAGQYPYDELMEFLKLHHNAQLALALFRSSLDTDYSDDLRRELANDAEELFVDDRIFQIVRSNMLSAQFSRTLKSPDKEDTRVKKLIAEVAKKRVLAEGMKNLWVMAGFPGKNSDAIWNEVILECGVSVLADAVAKADATSFNEWLEVAAIRNELLADARIKQFLKRWQQEVFQSQKIAA